MTVTARGAGYQANRMFGGTRHRYTFSTAAAAIDWERAAEIAFTEGRDIPIPTNTVAAQKDDIMSIRQLHDRTKKDKWMNKKSGVKLARNAEFFVDWAGPATTIQSVSSRMLYDYVSHLRTKVGNDDATVNRKISAVKVMLRKALQLELIPLIPHVEHFHERSAGAASDFLNFGEEAHLLELLTHIGRPEIAHLVVFMIDTGARIDEALSMNLNNIIGTSVRFEHTKNGGWRTIPLTRRANEAMNLALAIKWDKPHGKDNERGPWSGLTYRVVFDTLKMVYHKLGGRYANISQPLHIFRHSCASRLAIRGVDANRIREWMGHSSLSVTMRYMKLAPGALDDVVSALE